ncbi:threonine--tRNA ligase [Gehongia tenuis]|uniref:Threonine--tRNA ligase n=1 Tax=Gehongia tenuis TaxID=2763655 RepID=A0A926D3M4_9FIRM|nr:threonine--tRNA ligase [Gehongia tenuis]MBC8530636.1 threonine--tRNA ligase [Gehongia tenuis]
MNIKLGEQNLSLEQGALPLHIAKAYAPKEIYKKALAAKLNGETIDLFRPLTGDGTLEFLTFEDEDGRWALRHTASHVLAQAVKRLYPSAKLAIGPATRDGFYYDFDVEEPFTQEDLAKIEKEMAKIIKENHRMERFELPRQEALELMKEEPYKVELIEDLPEGETISFYRQGEFTDLCAGPHVPSTGKVKHVKLESLAGAYWRGSEKNKMLQRIYGTAFEDKKEMEAFLEAKAEARKRDHNKLGRELGFFTTVDYIGQGLPILLPKGSKAVQLMQRFVEDEEEKRGYILTKTPFMAKADLYKISGHWDHYYDTMFVLGDKEMDERGEEVLALRPMTCPFQFQVYLNKTRSYRDLPMRLGETSTLFRKESSGEMHGLIRVRQFTISEGHLAVTPEQLEDEFKGVLDLIQYLLGILGIAEDITYRFSKWDPNNKEKYIGSAEEWERTQDLMRVILDDLRIDYTEAEGEAAFYGPKLDIQAKNVYGKEDTLITVQIDFQLAERFGMVYTDRDGEKKHPIIIHRTSIGCYERTLALLIEKYAGAMPTWLSLEQCRILTITDRAEAWAEEVRAQLEARGVRVKIDSRNEKIGFKIREAQLEKLPYMLVVGDKEVENRAVAVRSRGEGDLGVMTPAEFADRIVLEIASKAHP